MNQAPAIDFTIQVIVEPDEGGFHAYCPALKGLHTGGDTEEEALQNARDAAIAYLRSLLKHGEPIPVGIDAKRTPPRKNGPIHHHTEHLSLTAI